MKPTPLIDRLHDLATSPAPGPDPAFVARLGVELHHMDQVPVMSERRPPSHRTHWLRFFSLAVPAGAIALAGAFVALRPGPSRPNQVRTAGPGVTAPDTDQVEPGQRVVPPTTVLTAPAVPTTVRSNAAPPATTPTTEATRHLVVPGPDAGPATTVTTTPRHEPTTSTTAPPTSPEALNLHCTAGSPGGTATVSCTWSPSSAPAFYAYRLTREKPGTNRVVAFTSNSRTATAYADHDVAAGSGYSYWIDALDTSGNVVGHGTATVTCC